MLLVILVPSLLAVQRIALFGENVHILYVSKIALDSSVLLLMLTPDYTEKGKVTRCNMQFLEIAHYGKKHALFEFMKRPQHIDVLLTLLQPRLAAIFKKALLHGSSMEHLLCKSIQ